jgi:S-adenosyl-L-methionine hydrolase (adenosine-forming)
VNGPPVVTFLSDFGVGDAFVGVCEGVIARICPGARVVHLTHGIAPQRVGHGARVLAASIRYLPVGVHVAVVDPGVGTERRGLALRSGDGRHFVGPDNGVLVPAAEASGGVEAAHELRDPAYMLHPVSPTFHGRDVFAPAAAHLARGVPLATFGPAVDPADLARPEFAGFQLDGAVLDASVEHVDRFGNVRVSVLLRELAGLFRPPRPAEIHVGEDHYLACCASTFADVGTGELVLYEDSAGFLSIAINRGSAADLMAPRLGGPVRIDFDPPHVPGWEPLP